MSFGSDSGRTRSGSKGFSNKEKKQRKKKQEYHIHKRGHFQEAEHLDQEEVRRRTILALDRLGHQVLSSEPGGYDLEHWTKSINSLLDDFQEKLGDGIVGVEFLARRQQALSGLVASSSAAELDQEIEKVIREEAAANAAIDEAASRASARLVALKEEREASVKELKREKDKLAEMTEARQSRQFFSRILRAGPSTEQAEASVARCETKLKGVEDEIERLRKARLVRGSASGEGDPAFLEAQQRFEAARGKLLELQSSRQNLLQLAHEREVATQTLSGIISALKIEGPATSDAAGG